MIATARLRNLTPHPITIATSPPLVLPPEQPTPRLSFTSDPTDHVTIDGRRVPITDIRAATVTDLPAAEPGVLLIVSRAVAAATPTRPDLVIPHDLVRDTAGDVRACRGLARLHHEAPHA